jgi:hypothetical protein
VAVVGLHFDHNTPATVPVQIALTVLFNRWRFFCQFGAILTERFCGKVKRRLADRIWIWARVLAPELPQNCQSRRACDRRVPDAALVVPDAKVVGGDVSTPDPRSNREAELTSNGPKGLRRAWQICDLRLFNASSFTCVSWAMGPSVAVSVARM